MEEEIHGNIPSTCNDTLGHDCQSNIYLDYTYAYCKIPLRIQGPLLSTNPFLEVRALCSRVVSGLISD